MIPVHTSVESKEIDTFLINELGFPSLLLMENAAQFFVNYTKIKKKKVLIAVGTGNNGGDGLAIARLLANLNEVQICYIGNIAKATKDNLINYNLLKNYNVRIVHLIELQDVIQIDSNVDIIIDAVFGIGFNGHFSELYDSIFTKINKINAVKYAVDIPSGLFGSLENEVNTNTFQADTTVTMYGWKEPFTNKNNKNYCGKIIYSNLNVPNHLINLHSNKFLLEKSDIRNILKKRDVNSHKYNFGSVVSLCGSTDMTGAAELAANAAIEVGAGLVYAANFGSNKFKSEIINLTSEEDGSIDLFVKYKTIFDKANVILIGCGIGKNSKLINQLQTLLDSYPEKYFVIDADALNGINMLKLNKNVVLTPHYGEFQRISSTNSEKNLTEVAKAYALDYNCNLVLKGSTTIITDGITSYLNITGNAGLAKAGTGDVLAGIIAGIIAQTQNLLPASALGVYLHSLAADKYVEKFNEETLTASKLIKYLKRVIPK